VAALSVSPPQNQQITYSRLKGIIALSQNFFPCFSNELVEQISSVSAEHWKMIPGGKTILHVS